VNLRVIQVVSILLVALPVANSSGQTVKNGVADLSGFNSAEGMVYLWGEWEFYWDTLYDPNDSSAKQKPSLINVPGSWHRQGDYAVKGFATYRVKIILPKDQRGLAILCPVINSAARFFINGKLVEETGTVSSTREGYDPALRSTLLPMPDNTTEIELVVQISNFSYFSAGFPRTPMLDKATSILSRLNRVNGVENFFAGSLIAMCIYQLILFFLYQRGKSNLWLSLVCLGVGLRAMIVHGGSFLLPNLYPWVDWEIWKKLEFGSVYGITALFPLYVYDLFREQAPRKPLYVFLFIGGFLLLAVLFTKQYVYGQLLDVAHIALLFGFIYAIYSIVRAWRAGHSDARIILLGVLASFPFILMEILQNTSLTPVNFGLSYLVEIGVLVFLIFQIYLLAHHYAESYSNMEKTVEERTDQLTTANTVKDRLLSVVSHDIKSPLNSLRGILQMHNSGAITKEEFNQYSRMLEDDLNKTTILVDNILYWTASQLKGIQVREESFDLYTLVEENVRLLATIAMGKKISMSHNTPRNFIIQSDKNIINFVLRNLLSNAVKFSYEGGTVQVSVVRSEQQILIKVKDNGTGMDEETLATLQESENTVSTSGTMSEKGTGLGISLCKEYLKNVRSQLMIESAKGEGSEFKIILPV
jgi:signal transduction histidine kinase